MALGVFAAHRREWLSPGVTLRGAVCTAAPGRGGCRLGAPRAAAPGRGGRLGAPCTAALRAALLALLAPSGGRALVTGAGGTGSRTLSVDFGPQTFEVKKSRFIAYGARVASTAEAISFAERVASEHSKASHICWACVCSDGERAMDDGEPSGTAGRPILNAVQGVGLIETVIAVARFRNGPLLGAGGLMRAYGAAARQLVAAAEEAGVLENIVETSTVVIAAPAGSVGALYAVASAVSQLDSQPCEAVASEFVGHEVRVTFSVARGLEGALLARMCDATAGASRQVGGGPVRPATAET
ncbi:ribosomal protein S5 domain 2-type protein [Pavlovales sp. CCMP2436]|nr:ribosomal protein S5 domain 2-type protein [Pavlovales sp. CCMP2436]|mmetsp:Transcript_6782/g.16473  ORF Transcript_6782/g.16473 Transcript_6782/m.16473 type:complete len:299 (+) Transcript_6782:2-898(+)